MKLRSSLFVALTAVVLTTAAGVARSETVHQTVPADKFRTGDGAGAVGKGVMEAKRIEGAKSDGGQVARVKGDMVQWGFVTAWFGLPAPAGKSIVRLRIYNDGQKAAKYMLYTRDKDGQNGIGAIKLPDDAKENTFVTVDVPVDAKAEWSGLTIKKAEKSDLPGPWIDTVSIVLPD